MIFLGVYQDWLQCVYTVKRLLQRTDEKILLRSDGDYDETLATALFHQERVLIIKGKERLKARGCGGRNAHNYLSLYLKFSTESYLIKIDPDTGVNHAPTLPPEFDVACNYVKRSLRGGAMSSTRAKLYADKRKSLVDCVGSNSPMAIKSKDWMRQKSGS